MDIAKDNKPFFFPVKGIFENEEKIGVNNQDWLENEKEEGIDFDFYIENNLSCYNAKLRDVIVKYQHFRLLSVAGNASCVTFMLIFFDLENRTW